MISNQNLDDNIKRVPPTYSGTEAEDALANSLEGSFRVEVSTGVNNELFLALGSLVGYAMIMQFVPEEGGRVQVAVGPDGRSSTRTHNGESWGEWFGNGIRGLRSVTVDLVNNADTKYSWVGILPKEGTEEVGLPSSFYWYIIVNISNPDGKATPLNSNGYTVQLALRPDKSGGGLWFRVSAESVWGPWKSIMESENPNIFGDVKVWSEDKSVYDTILRHRHYKSSDGSTYFGAGVCLRAGQGLLLGSGEKSNQLYNQLMVDGFLEENIYLCSDRAIVIYYDQNSGIDPTKVITITRDGEIDLPGTPKRVTAAVPKSYVDALAARVKALEDKLK